MKSELEQAQELRDEARQLLEQSKLNLERSTRSNDFALGNLRKLTLAMSSLIPKPMLMQFNFNSEDDEYTAKQVFESINNREVFDIVHAINVLAMANTDVIHIFTHFSGHINNIAFSAEHVETNYQDINRQRDLLLRTEVRLKEEDALEQLLSIESQLTELIIEAREEAEQKEEVIS